MTEVGNLINAALERKERLKALRKRPGSFNDEPASKKSDSYDVEKLPKPVFRNYKPSDEALKENQLDKAVPEEVKEQVKEQLEMGKPEPVVKEIDLTTLAPRKPDWDLKRDVAKKLEKLDRRTQRAIAELIRERIRAGQEGLDAVVSQSVADTEDD